MPKIAKCKACGSADLFWFVSNKAAPCQFVLGCNHCSETLTVISADRVAEHLNASAEPSAPKCKTCHDQGEVFVRKGDVHYNMETEPEPVMAACPACAPVERDERAEFESWCAVIGYTLKTYEHGNGFKPGYGSELFSAWQARAALERKP